VSNYIIMVHLNNWEMTEAAIKDALAQDIGDVKVLAIAQGYVDSTRLAAEAWARVDPRLLNLWFDPPLLSLSACWNLGLKLAWDSGATFAMVCNNDIRLKPETYKQLSLELKLGEALFVSGVGVTMEQFSGAAPVQNDSKGGPDFSCFVISKDCHERYPFDPNFIPCYCEDLDLHRRIMLAGEGDRIFSVDVPYCHIDRGSGTLKSMTPETRAATEQMIANGSRAYYQAKWGGGVNEEKWLKPFDPESTAAATSTRDLFNQVREGWRK